MEDGANPVKREIGSSLGAGGAASGEKNGRCIAGRVAAKSSAPKAGSMLPRVNTADFISDADDREF